MKSITVLIKAFKNWLDDDPFTHSAASAYYAIFSFPGLIIISMGIAAFAFSEGEVQNAINGQLTQFLGPETAQNLAEIVEETQMQNRDTLALIAGIATLIFGATGLFAHLQRSLNHIFNVPLEKNTGFWAFIKARLLSFGLIVVLGFLLLISLLLSSMITLLNGWVSDNLSTSLSVIALILNLLVGVGIILFLFTLIYKVLPDKTIAWQSAFAGSIVATVFFKIGEFCINYYFETAEPASSFGASGSLVLLMLWVSYTCMILFIGAEYAYAYDRYPDKAKADK